MATNPANDLLVRAVMNNVSGLPRDSVINDFAFHYPGIPDANLPGLVALVSDFYRATQANGQKVSNFISGAISRALEHRIDVYRINADGSIGSPAYTEVWLGPDNPTSGRGLPTEVAGVLSIHADLTTAVEEVGATRPRARRRGRLYVGPLNDGAVRYDTPPYMLTDLFTETLRQAARTLCDDAGSVPPDGTGWCVWSRSDHILRPVVGGWTDNAPDTQRRRGPAATTRATWVA